MPNSFFSHSRVDPQDTITPSSAKSTCCSVLQQMVVIMPLPDAFGLSPMFIRIEQPVPNVALAVPGEKQPSPKAAACESPIMLLMGMGAGNSPSKSVSPKYDADGCSSGSFNRDKP